MITIKNLISLHFLIFIIFILWKIRRLILFFYYSQCRLKLYLLINYRLLILVLLLRWLINYLWFIQQYSLIIILHILFLLWLYKIKFLIYIGIWKWSTHLTSYLSIVIWQISSLSTVFIFDFTVNKEFIRLSLNLIVAYLSVFIYLFKQSLVCETLHTVYALLVMHFYTFASLFIIIRIFLALQIFFVLKNINCSIWS